MKTIWSLIFSLFISIHGIAQHSKDSSAVKIDTVKIIPRQLATSSLFHIDPTYRSVPNGITKFRKKLPNPFWTIKNELNLLLTQNAFINWSAGGDNSISGILRTLFVRNYKNKHLIWNNELKGNYGLNKKEGQNTRKTEDLIELNSTFGYRTNTVSNWYYSANFNFRTQFFNGYRYPDTDNAISKFLAPAYIFLGVGSAYTSKDKKFKLYLSPITNKTTLVLSQKLANEGAFGVVKAVYDADGNLLSEGENSKVEFGSLFTGEWNHEIMANILMRNKLGLYSDYLDEFGNIDIDWELKLDLIVNKYVKANVGTRLVYDDNVNLKKKNAAGETEILGPRVQLKQLLGVGLSYSF